MPKINNIARNTSYFTFALILQKIISFTYFTILARNLIPADLGKYYFAISFTTIFAIFIDLGMANVLMREIAKKKERARELLGTIMFLKLPLALLSILSAVVLVNILHYPDLTKHLVYLSLICVTLDSFTITFWAVLRGYHNLTFESIASIVFQVIVLGFGLTAIKLNLGLRWIITALVMASSFNFLFSASLTRFKWKIKLSPLLKPKLLKSLVVITVPFAIFGIFQKLYMYLDTVLLSILAGDKYVGLYQIAFKIIFALQFLPMAFMASLYPAFAAYWKSNREQLVVSFERAVNYLVFISLPISIGVIVIADKVILLFSPEYLEAVLPLRIIMGSLLFIFLNFPVGALLNACDRQSLNTRNMGIALFLSVMLNLILIVKYKAVGAAITVVTVNALMLTLGLSCVPLILKYRPRKIIIPFLKALFAALIMGGAVLFLKLKLNIFIVVLIGAIIYASILLLTKAIRKEDIASIINSFLKSNKVS